MRQFFILLTGNDISQLKPSTDSNVIIFDRTKNVLCTNKRKIRISQFEWS